MVYGFARAAARIRNPLWLPLLPAAVCLADVALTLAGQPAAYWRGDYAAVNEGNPLPRLFLERHPLAFAAGVAAYLAGLTAFALLAPRRWAAAACLALVCGHGIGAAAWLLRLGPAGLGLAAALAPALAVLAVPTWRARSGPAAEDAAEDQDHHDKEHQPE
jgi:hypothetical protein